MDKCNFILECAHLHFIHVSATTNNAYGPTRGTSYTTADDRNDTVGKSSDKKGFSSITNSHRHENAVKK
jgi:hypothetical protein